MILDIDFEITIFDPNTDRSCHFFGKDQLYQDETKKCSGHTCLDFGEDLRYLGHLMHHACRGEFSTNIGGV